MDAGGLKNAGAVAEQSKLNFSHHPTRARKLDSNNRRDNATSEKPTVMTLPLIIS
jgi:hypothetical protein